MARTGRPGASDDALWERIRAAHGNKYQYPNGFAKDEKKRILVRCPVHGDFYQYLYSHLEGKGCSKCAGRGLSTDEWISRAKRVHGDAYDYSHTIFSGARNKLTIHCRVHGDFEQVAYSHLNGNGCPQCWWERKKDIEESKRVSAQNEFIRKATEIHGEKYDYSLVSYSNHKEPVLIVCPDHGEFWQAPSVQLRGGGCPACARIRTGSRRRNSIEKFIAKAREVHGDERYDYSSLLLKDTHTPVTIICPIHGAFQQTPANHLYGQGCLKCGVIERGLSAKKQRAETIIQDFLAVHGDKGYKYDQFVYKGFAAKSTVICPVHGPFKVNPANHLMGCGCPQCARENRPQYIDARIKNDPEFAMRDGVLYLLAVDHPNHPDTFYKIGITSQKNSIERYAYSQYSRFHIYVFHEFRMSMADAWQNEHEIKALIKSNRWGIVPFTEDYWHWTESFRGDAALQSVLSHLGISPLKGQ